jgi:hypothetical protein
VIEQAQQTLSTAAIGSITLSLGSPEVRVFIDFQLPVLKIKFYLAGKNSQTSLFV